MIHILNALNQKYITVINNKNVVKKEENTLKMHQKGHITILTKIYLVLAQSLLW